MDDKKQAGGIVQNFALWAMRRVFRGKKLYDPAPLEVNKVGSLKVTVEQANSPFPSLTIGAATVSSIPNVTANPTKPVSLAHGLLGNSIAALYTFSAAHRGIVIHVCNVDTSERTFTIQINSTSGSADDTHTRVKTHRLEVGDFTKVWIPGAVTSDIIYGLCDSANKVSYEIWGIP